MVNNGAKMIITINGLPGSGKSTLAKFLARKLKMRYYSIGKKRRQLALSKGITIDELNKIGEKDPSTDKPIDDFQRKIGKKDNIIVDGRLSWYFIPNSIKIFLKVDMKKGAERIMKANRKSERKYKSLKDAINEIKERIDSDKKRYKKYYNINNVYDIKNYDIVMDTTDLSIKEMCNLALKAINEFQENKRG